MYYSQDIIEEVRLGNDIIDVINKYTSLKQKGNTYFGLCPFHKENTPSFSVSPDKQLYHCFGCGASGNIISFIMQAENYDFIDAIKHLANRINYNLPEAELSDELKRKNELKNVLYEIHKKAARFFYNNLNTVEGEKAVRYLNGRNIFLNIRKKYGLGYSPFRKDELFKTLSSQGYDIDTIIKSGLVIKDKNGNYRDRFINRLMFPIIDVHGKIIGFGGRLIGEGEPKYLNSPETVIFNKSQNLYSMNFARQTKLKEFIVVEGYIDAISLYQYGFKNVVATLGTAFNNEHAKALKKYAQSVILLFDSDKAGINAILHAIPFLIKNGIYAKILQVEGAKDPDEYLNKFGTSAFDNLIRNNSKSYISFQIEQIKSKYNINNTQDKITFTNEVSKLLSTIDNSIEKDVYIKSVSSITNVSEEAIKNEITKNTTDIKINHNIKNHTKTPNTKEECQIDNARKDIINILSSNVFIYNILKGRLNSEEFIKPIYVKLINIIYDIYEKNNIIYPAEIVNFFDNIEQQKLVSDIFMLQPKFENNEELEKAVNQEVKIIKKAYIKHNIDNADNIDNLKDLINENKKLDKFYIKFSEV